MHPIHFYQKGIDKKEKMIGILDYPNIFIIGLAVNRFIIWVKVMDSVTMVTVCIKRQNEIVQVETHYHIGFRLV